MIHPQAFCDFRNGKQTQDAGRKPAGRPRKSESGRIFLIISLRTPLTAERESFVHEIMSYFPMIRLMTDQTPEAPPMTDQKMSPQGPVPKWSSHKSPRYTPSPMQVSIVMPALDATAMLCTGFQSEVFFSFSVRSTRPISLRGNNAREQPTPLLNYTSSL